MTDSTFNGWANWETWSVSLWIQNDEPLYRLARRFRHHGYKALVPMLQDYMGFANPDGCDWDDPALDVDELDEMLEEL